MRTCLVVDDSSVIRKVARRILEGLDFQILEAEDGEKALEACKRGLPACDPSLLTGPEMATVTAAFQQRRVRVRPQGQ